MLFTLVTVLALLDAFRGDFELSPLVLVPLLVTGGALYAVDIPGLGQRDK